MSLKWDLHIYHNEYMCINFLISSLFLFFLSSILSKCSFKMSKLKIKGSVQGVKCYLHDLTVNLSIILHLSVGGSSLVSFCRHPSKVKLTFEIRR